MVYTYQFEAFTSPCELHIDAPTPSAGNDAAKVVFENAKRLEHLYSFFRSDSEIFKLNNRTHEQHILSDELAGLVQLALFYHNATQGAFDIAVAGTLKSLSDVLSFDEYSFQKEILTPFASSNHLSLEGNRLTFTNPNTKIDFGGLVKEYAVDESILFLQTMGVESALVNFGGDIASIGDYYGSPWRIGIQDPLKPETNMLEVDLIDSSLCTSGHSKRFHMIESTKISHIISNLDHTGIGYSQVSILAPTTVDAGVWSTALLVNPDMVLPEHLKVFTV